MTDPVFLARLLAASQMAVVLALCANNNAKACAERTQHPVHSASSSR